MRTTVTIDSDVYEAALHMAQVSGKRLGSVLSDLARRGLQPTPAVRRKSGRFPVFEVPADAPKLSMAKIQRAIDEDGIV